MQLEKRRVYIALGSNLASPLEQVNAAVKAIGEIPDSRIVAVSSFYRTPPLGPQDQPDYLNAAVALETTLAPEELLNHTQRIELQQGRVRKAERWGPRTLDLDIMLFGDEVINTERLTVPHYDMKNRVLCCGRSLKSRRILSFQTINNHLRFSSSKPLLVRRNCNRVI